MQLLEEAVHLGLIKKEEADCEALIDVAEHKEQCNDDGEVEDNDVKAPEDES